MRCRRGHQIRWDSVETLAAFCGLLLPLVTWYLPKIPNIEWPELLTRTNLPSVGTSYRDSGCLASTNATHFTNDADANADNYNDDNEDGGDRKTNEYGDLGQLRR
jgi:hypothetical protein